MHMCVYIVLYVHLSACCCFQVPDCLYVYECLWLSKYVPPCEEDDTELEQSVSVCATVREALWRTSSER